MGVSNRLRNHPHDEASGEGWLRLAAGGISVIMKVMKPDGIQRYASPASGRVLGYEAGEVVGAMDVPDHAHPDDLPRVTSEIEKIVSSVTGDTSVVECRFRHRNSTWRCVEGAGVGLLESPGGRESS